MNVICGIIDQCDTKIDFIIICRSLPIYLCPVILLNILKII